MAAPALCDPNECPTVPGTFNSEVPELDHLDQNAYGIIISDIKGSAGGRKKSVCKTESRVARVKIPEKEPEQFSEEEEAASNSCDNDPDSNLDKDWLPDALVTLNNDVKVRRTSRRTTRQAKKPKHQKQISNVFPAQEPKHKCDTCSKTYRHFSTLQLHRKAHRLLWSHSMVRKYMHLAHRCCTRESSLEKPHTCSKCGRIFNLSSSCLQHWRQHHSVDFACNKCKSTFPTRLRLAKHRIACHRDSFLLRTKTLHGCQGCRRFFVHKSNLKQHIAEAHAAVPKKKRGRGRPRKYDIAVSPQKPKMSARKSKAGGVWYTCQLCLARFHSRFLRKYKEHLVEAHDLTDKEVREACESSKHKGTYWHWNENSPSCRTQVRQSKAGQQTAPCNIWCSFWYPEVPCSFLPFCLIILCNSTGEVPRHTSCTTAIAYVVPILSAGGNVIVSTHSPGGTAVYTVP